MKVNTDKSKVMLFNTSRIFDFKPSLSLDQLLGVFIQSNMKWNLNTDYICAKAFERVWMIRRLKLLGASDDELTDVYVKQVRCILEMAVAVWSAGLTVSQGSQIERVQKTVCAVILGDRHTDYKQSLNILNLKPLRSRRQELCAKFSNKCHKSEKYQSWYSENNSTVNTRSDKSGVLPVPTRTRRYEKSPLPYLTSLVNEVLVNKVS